MAKSLFSIVKYSHGIMLMLVLNYVDEPSILSILDAIGGRDWDCTIIDYLQEQIKIICRMINLNISQL